VVLDNAANGGASVGRDASGRATFCDGGLPGETVSVALDTEKKRFARGRVIEILEPAAGRIEPVCPTHAAGCGGCDLAHATAELQAEMKQQVVTDSLIRIGGCESEDVRRLLEASNPSITSEASGYRTTVRAAIQSGRAGYRRRGSHDVIAAGECGVAHPLVEELLVEGRFGESAGPEVVLRASAMTNERLALVDGAVDEISLPDDVVVVSRKELAEGREVHLTEHAGGREWRVSAGSFFQAGPAVATALVDAVSGAAGSTSGLTVVDAYAGIGLFGGTVGAGAARLISVERSGSSTDDARVNLAGLPAEIIETSVEDWGGSIADVVIADPSRSGLGRDGVDSLMACAAERFVLVSCDTGSLGRDAGLLQNEGYELESIRIVDAFPDTSHVETVVGLRRTPS